MPTKIKLKRADNSSSLSGITLDHGEPAVDFDQGVLYIGNGVASPGIAFGYTDNSSISIHQIASEVSIGTQHTISAKKRGAVLKALTSNTARMERLGFYDLGAIADVTSGGLVLHSGSDNTGMMSRWHWMDTHTAPKNSIFFTDSSSYTNVGSGVGSGVGNMAHSNTSGSDTGVGYQVRSISYDIADLTDTSNGYMPLVAYKSGSLNLLGFRRLSISDLTGGAPVHDMTSTSHTMAALSVVYTGTAANSMKYASYSGAATGSVLKKVSTAGTLEFGRLSFSDITGSFRLPGDGTSNEGFTLRYDATGGTGWEHVSNVRVLRTTGYNRLLVDNGAMTERSPEISLRNYGDEGPTILDILIPVGLQGPVNQYAENKITFNSSNISGANRDMLFYTYHDRAIEDERPNIWFRPDGGLWIRGGNLTSPTHDSFVSDITGQNSSIFVYGRNISRITGSPSNYIGYNGLFIGDITHTQSVPTTPNTEGICGIKLGTISTINSGTATTNSHHNLYFIKTGNLNTPAHAYGISFGSINAGLKLSAEAYGIRISSVNSAADQGEAYGMFVPSISSSGSTSSAVGYRIDSITADYIACALKASSITSNIDSSFILASDIVSNAVARGIVIGSIDSTGTTSSLAFGMELSSITANQLAIGSYMKKIRGTVRSIGMLIGVGAANVSYNDVTGSSVAIWTAGGEHVFGGATKITGTTTIIGDTGIDGNITVSAAKTMTLIGSARGSAPWAGTNADESGPTVLNISNGNVNIANGLLKITAPQQYGFSQGEPGIIVERGSIRLKSGTVRTVIQDITVSSTQSLTGTDYLISSFVLNKTNTFRLTASADRTIYRLGGESPNAIDPTPDGMIIYLINDSQYEISLGSRINNGYSTNYVSDIAGAVSSSSAVFFKLKPHNALALIYDAEPHFPTSQAVSGNTSYKWKVLNYNYD